MARKKDNGIPSVLFSIFVGAPWWIGPIFVVGAYALFRFGVPALVASGIFAHQDNAGIQVMNKTFTQVIGGASVKFAPWAALLVLVMWGLGLFEKSKRQRLLEQSRDIEGIRALSWRDFELLIGEYYRRAGYVVEDRGGGFPDGGVDLARRKDGRTTLVQCKHWKALKVGVGVVRELLGVITSENAQGGVFVTSGVFTSDAKSFAEKNHIELVDGAALVPMIRAVQGSDRSVGAVQDPPPRPAPRPADSASTPPCPQCGKPMVLRRAGRGTNAGAQFYGCSGYPACRGTRELGTG